MSAWLRWSASTIACSRPPPPTTRTFMIAMRRWWRPGFLVSRTPPKTESLRRLHELEEVPLRIFERHDTAPRVIADLADELHALVSHSLDVGSDVRRLERQDGPFRRGLAVGRIEPDAETSHVHGAPVGALLRHRQIQHVAVERDGAFHVLDFVVDVLNARDHRPTLRAPAMGVSSDSRYVGAGPAALRASSAAYTVFDRSIAIVIGPTPPGTGELASALGRTASKARPPTLRSPLFALPAPPRVVPPATP